MPTTQEDSSKPKEQEQERRLWYWPLVFAAALLLVNSVMAAVLVLAVNSLDETRFEPEIKTAMVLIIGVIGLVSVMSLLVAVFRHYDPDSQTGALGLPDGSVQAVIALLLILIFAIFGVYLHGRAGSPERRQSACLTRGQVSVIPNGTVVRVKPERWRRGSACTEEPPKATVTRPPRNANARQRRRARQATRRSAAAAARNTVIRYRVTVAVANVERDNITTQLLSTIGTLVVAVAGFYFGAKAVQAGVKRGRESAQGGAAIARDALHPKEPPQDGDGVQGVRPRPGGPPGDEDEEDPSAYGDVSPVARGPSPGEVRDEMRSPPLADEEAGEESLREQGAEETVEEAGDEDFVAAPGEAEPEAEGATGTEDEDASEDEDLAAVEDEPLAQEAGEDDAATYGDVSPVTRGPSRDDVREELQSAPLIEEDDADESLLEQGVEETPEDEADDDLDETPSDDEAGDDGDDEVEDEPDGEDVPEEQDENEPPEKV